MIELYNLFCMCSINKKSTATLEGEKIQEMPLTNTQIQEMPSTNASSMKCHRTSDFVPKISSPLRFRPSLAVKYTVHPITLNGGLITKP